MPSEVLVKNKEVMASLRLQLMLLLNLLMMGCWWTRALSVMVSFGVIGGIKGILLRKDWIEC